MGQPEWDRIDQYIGAVRLFTELSRQRVGAAAGPPRALFYQPVFQAIKSNNVLPFIDAADSMTACKAVCALVRLVAAEAKLAS